ncbi:unnamed protein product [Nesidiocoris tenuis]|uniref:DUF4802 domain-containing protein n=1 Tax=Nesidiocoris tenuis TaxID=355587 RepID=A0A6H5GMP6_9HEMI|nr:unnamed protein product [Nesidiocoris tenuis]
MVPSGSSDVSSTDTESTQLLDTVPSSPPPPYEHVLAESHYFDCEYDRDNENEKTDGGLGAGTPMFISEVMHGTACSILNHFDQREGKRFTYGLPVPLAKFRVLTLGTINNHVSKKIYISLCLLGKVLKVQEGIELAAYESIPGDQRINLFEILGDHVPPEVVNNLQAQVDQIVTRRQTSHWWVKNATVLVFDGSEEKNAPKTYLWPEHFQGSCSVGDHMTRIKIRIYERLISVRSSATGIKS